MNFNQKVNNDDAFFYKQEIEDIHKAIIHSPTDDLYLQNILHLEAALSPMYTELLGQKIKDVKAHCKGYIEWRKKLEAAIVAQKINNSRAIGTQIYGELKLIEYEAGLIGGKKKIGLANMTEDEEEKEATTETENVLE